MTTFQSQPTNQIMKLSFRFLPAIFFTVFLMLSWTSPQNKSEEVSNCLAAYHGKPEALLTYDLVEQFIDFKGVTPSLNKISEQIIRDPNFAQVNCKWKDGKKNKEVALKQISQIKLYESKTPVDRFYDKYHTKTEAEQEALEQTYREEVENKTDNKNAGLIGNVMDMNFEYINIDGLGDAAVWEHKVNDLIVLVGDYQFKLYVDLKEGNEYDLEKAILIANGIISKACN